MTGLVDEHDDIQYAPNSFYNIWTYNEYVKVIYENKKAGHLNDLLMNNGFVCTEDLYEAPEKLDKKVIKEMKGMTATFFVVGNVESWRIFFTL